MFTGIVEAVGLVVDVEPSAAGRSLAIESEGVVDGMTVGSSVAVNGACLTAVDVTQSGFSVQAVSETIDRTNLGSLEPGDRVNLERAMSVSDRFDGHIVQGHVDGLGIIDSLEPDDLGVRMGLTVPETLRRYLVEKGSVTVDGVSLTVASLTSTGIQIALIPHTLEITTLGDRRPGDRVNLEVDVLAKYVERLAGSLT